MEDSWKAIDWSLGQVSLKPSGIKAAGVNMSWAPFLVNQFLSDCRDGLYKSITRAIFRLAELIREKEL